MDEGRAAEGDDGREQARGKDLEALKAPLRPQFAQAMAEVASAVREVCGACAMLIYSSASSTDDTRKWRVLIPLAQAISGQLYVRMQLALFEALAMFGITADGALARAGQPVFLPNVPPERRDADALRRRRHVRGDGVCFPGLPGEHY